MKSAARLRQAGAFALLALFSHGVAAESFRFGWPVPCTAIVSANMDKKGNTSTARYKVSVTPGPGDELSLNFSEFEFVSLNGADVSDPRLAAQLGPLAALTSALPTMRLSRTGSYLGTAGLDAMMERILAAMGENLDAATRERVSRQFRSPEMQALMQQKSGELWNVWVGAWNGVDIESGQTLQGTIPVDLLGRQLEQKMLIEHLGAAPGSACCVKLRLTTILEGPEVVKLLLGMIEDLAPRGQPVDPSMFVFARSTNVVEVITEATILKPRQASTLTEIFLEDADGEKHRRTDRQSFTFEWR